MSENTEVFELLNVEVMPELNVPDDTDQIPDEIDRKQPNDNDQLKFEQKETFHYTISDHDSPTITAATAVPSVESEPLGLSDDDAPKILTTLESVTKNNEISNKSEVLLITDTPSTQDTVDDSAENDSDDLIIPIDSESEIAQLQLARLEKRSRAKRGKIDKVVKVNTTQENGKPITATRNDIVNIEIISENVEKPDKSNNDDFEIPTLQKMHNRLTQVLQETVNKTPARTKSSEKQNPPGTIEIPRELILATHDTNSPLNFNDPQTSLSLQNEELIAILEGEDNKSEHSDANKYSNKESNTNQATNARETERKLALKQIMQLPSKRNRKQSQLKKNARNLIESIVSEWSDTEPMPGNDNNSIVVKKVKVIKKREKKHNFPVEIKNKKLKIDSSPVTTDPQSSDEQVDKSKIQQSNKPKALNNSLSMPEPTFKRSRIIKKKIIWDPDAPETAISYASLLHRPTPSRLPKSNKIAEKQYVPKKIESKLKSDSITTTTIDTNDTKKRIIQTPSPSLKRQKCTELDRLLRDEGAVNMLYSLEHENNNAELVATEEDTAGDPDLELKTRTIKTLVTNQNKLSPVQRARHKRAPTPQIPQVLNTPKKETTKRRYNTNKTTSASSSWDYIYTNRRDDDSMIVRRRSNSSYSSTTSPNRLSIDGPSTSTVGPSMKLKQKDKFEFIKPSARKHIKIEQQQQINQSHSILNDLKGNDALSSRRSKRLHTISNDTFNMAAEIKTERIDQSSIQQYDELVYKRNENFVHLILSPQSNKITNSFTIPLMKSITQALFDLSSNNNCKSVVITSANDDFCTGLDYSSLIQNTIEKRKTAARELFKTLRNFINAMATFNKPLIGGLSGRTNGIGLTILPLFDFVYSTQKTTFALPHLKAGLMVECCSILSLTQKVKKGFINELLYFCETQTSTDAQQNGLITKILNQNTFQSNLMNIVKDVSSTTGQLLESTKSLMHSELVVKLNDTLDREEEQLIQHWSSVECQEKFKQFIQNGNW